jgi:23S rRNA pseudouridine955/2504/2580 synthase
MAYVGHPILGDRKYGNIEVNRRCDVDARRPLLHAYELGFPKTLSGVLEDLAGKVFRASVPSDMAALLGGRGWVLPESPML